MIGWILLFVASIMLFTFALGMLPNGEALIENGCSCVIVLAILLTFLVVVILVLFLILGVIGYFLP